MSKSDDRDQDEGQDEGISLDRVKDIGRKVGEQKIRPKGNGQEPGK